MKVLYKIVCVCLLLLLALSFSHTHLNNGTMKETFSLEAHRHTLGRASREMIISKEVNTNWVDIAPTRVYGFDHVATSERVKHVRAVPQQHFIRKLNTELPYFSLTFDDCPAGHIEDILDVLKKYNMRGTFFVMGVYVQLYPEVTKRILAEGHTIANHTYDHKLITCIDLEEVRWEIQYTEDLVYETAGVKTVLFRPPGGSISEREIKLIYSMGYSVAMWSIDTRDWESVPRAVEVAKRANKGDIVLFHTKAINGRAMEELCKYYQDMGLKSVPVEELFALVEVEEHSVEWLSKRRFWVE